MKNIQANPIWRSIKMQYGVGRRTAGKERETGNSNNETAETPRSPKTFPFEYILAEKEIEGESTLRRCVQLFIDPHYFSIACVTSVYYYDYY